MDERLPYSTIQNLKELTDGKYEDLDKGDIDEGNFTKGIFADNGAVNDEEVGYHSQELCMNNFTTKYKDISSSGSIIIFCTMIL